MDKERPLLFRGQRLNMQMFTPQEIKNESVLKVIDSMLYDDMGHSVVGGLHDSRLGAMDSGSPCGSCNLGYNRCLGHFGHIDLPLPVYNPMTYDVLTKVLKQACTVCYRFRMGKDESEGYTAQIKLARYGYEIEAAQVGDLLKDMKYAEVKEVLKNTITEGTAQKEDSVETMTHAIRNRFFGLQNKACMWCGSSERKITSGSLRILIEKEAQSKEGPSVIKEELLLPIEAVQMVQKLTQNEEGLLGELFPSMHRKVQGTNFLLPMFFIEVVLVTPNQLRPMNKLANESIVPNPRTVAYQNIISVCIDVFNLEDRSAKSVTANYIKLQEVVSELYSARDVSSSNKAQAQGLKQLIEKKDGIFRKNIMGKRVNYIARSVISPDPAIGVDEVGLPVEFASKLTIPVGISPVNIEGLRQAVINGPEYPGAEFVEDSSGRLISLKYISRDKRIHLANQLLTCTSFNAHSITDKDAQEVFTGEVDRQKIEGNIRRVWRHMRSGDNVLVNRQPSLHKVSMMGHKVKVLPRERTIRLHYVNCNSYNADFDGDEMNVHFPQDIASQVEVAEVCSTNHCFISATNGAPVRGHVQDHVVMGAILSQKNIFVEKDEYAQLLVAALGNIPSIKKYALEQPAILRPVRKYTGNQCITGVIRNLGIDISISCKTKLSDQFITRNGVVICGSLDKSQIGTSSYGLTHAVNEKYGGAMSNNLLTAIGRLLNRALVVFGHSCTMDDLAIFEGAEHCRRQEIEQGLLEGSSVSNTFLENNPEYLLKVSRIAAIGEVPEDKKELDAEMRKPTSECSSKVLDITSAGLCTKGKSNRMYIMVASGAKGSLVNLGQIISMLGQQELEGMRVPMMPTGRTLPTFNPLENTPRAHGFIAQRFLTGVHPEEFYFHCMAGREGLIDTAVKTSRSGYLQRCLIKHLEGLRIDVDGSVKDADGSVIQMVYGEDGIHPEKSAYLHNHEFFNQNQHGVSDGKIHGVLGINTGELYNMRTITGRVSEKYLKSSERSIRKDNLWERYIKCTAEPGEAVGVLAAQSVGEPSTQMTLNTFHLAGVGGKNVTLGMPRLKELVMHATKKIKTPIMTVEAKRPPTPGEEQILNVSGRKSLLSLITGIKLSEQVLLYNTTPVQQLKISITPFSAVLDAVESALRSEFFVRFSRNMKMFFKSLASQEITETSKELKELVLDNPDEDEDASSSSTSHEDLSDEEPSDEDGKDEQESDHEEDKFEGKFEEPSCVNDGTTIHITLHTSAAYKTLYMPRIEGILSKMYLETGATFESCTYNNSQYFVQQGGIHSLFDRVGDSLLCDLMDVTTVRSNSIWEMFSTLGIEAARSSIIREIAAVFEVYGITIDYRHLSLIADYMTHKGTIISFNRSAFSVMGSPIQRISYETAYTFIKDTIVDSSVDNLINPSSCLTIGKPIPIGTNMSEVGYNID
ncbi:hypothetical protein NEPAR06_1801 [Nematocida parisii]|uniref:RNA polymerase 2 n=1 Tax=Nematocida parisii (strain ERTm1 / ATCC PRA-289) TaxID=881290 RepID=UPI000264B54C|nr:RNA polymerase 2 [Nematocida parisii ERTm1]KAI5145482.1 hypothetical protein NEPAR04_2455 [Nematocida parisii]EIJ94277.1 RNA polymerase 2 [Nematocida parisii ERTm1]KAI5145535.1 hypothetical protein NEPAR07_1754 [Nematocida parisii]KAI5155408.1 hypothetical protein NEPAR06_1801 [Nematocida parisii]KAI5158100.1 hypothetical protein NEPAR05_1867 [Nematocida parisii]|eukprot:XP_013058773.1 RNA polymerase 2 [Nematocida parisii ERTm1]